MLVIHANKFYYLIDDIEKLLYLTILLYLTKHDFSSISEEKQNHEF